jgi:S-adenosylmethionine:tRNA ribosyltransferase-isomerase
VLTSDFDYELPQEQIAQTPAPRGASRLMILDRAGGGLVHGRVADLKDWLAAGDVLVLNDTRVIPARVYATRSTGRRFELLLVEQAPNRAWEALVRPSARARVGERLWLADGGALLLEEHLGGGHWLVRPDTPLDLERLEAIGEAPLPPYIDRPDGATADDRRSYQTVYARVPGAIAAPTAGLHLTGSLLDEISAGGVELVFLTLHVGIGTFRPVSVDRVADHRMHSERYLVDEASAATINAALAAGRRIVCVGTTSVRALEGGLAAGGGRLAVGAASTDLFITPGYRFRGVGALLTNFHLPRSTLLMLVSAFSGRERTLAAYREAVERGYRFFSYGDAMLVV